MSLNKKYAPITTLLLGLVLYGSVFPQEIEVDPEDEIEAVFNSNKSVIRVTEPLEFRFRAFVDGSLKKKVTKLQFGIPYVIEATYKLDPRIDRLSIRLDWAVQGVSADELEMVRVVEGMDTFYRSSKIIILEEMDISR